jgi:hypothetical protein
MPKLKPLSCGKGFLFSRQLRLGSPSLFSPANYAVAHACGRRISKKHLTNLIFNCKNDHYGPVYK